MVIGAGFAGLEVARVSTIRGHEVSIMDTGERVGGIGIVASAPSFKKRIKELIGWYERQITQLRVPIQFNTQVTTDTITGLNPDVLVVATGSKPIIPEILGIEYALSSDDILLGRKTAGQRVVLIGGGLEGLDTALFLAKQGKQVTIVKRYPEIGRQFEETTRMSFVRKSTGLIDKYNIKIMTEISVLEINKRGVGITDKFGNRSFLEANCIIYARGRHSVIDNKLLNSVNEVFVIGDAKQPRKIIDAIHEGFMTAVNI